MTEKYKLLAPFKIALLTALLLAGSSRTSVATYCWIPAYMARMTLQIAPPIVALDSPSDGAGALGRRG